MLNVAEHLGRKIQVNYYCGTNGENACTYPQSNQLFINLASIRIQNFIDLYRYKDSMTAQELFENHSLNLILILKTLIHELMHMMENKNVMVLTIITSVIRIANFL